jgi:hypothetical protein
VREGRGRKPSIGAEKVAAIVHATLHETPPGETHWSCRSMARVQGVSPATVQRIWPARGLQPHRVETFRLSHDKRFEERLIDVVGLYLNPPDKAVVLCMDEKSQIQALDRTQPTGPMKPGRAGTMTHDCKRNGTTTLFAALDVLTGKVIGQCLPKHRNTEFLRFLRRIDREVPKGLAIHLILDNYGAQWCPMSDVDIEQLAGGPVERDRGEGYQPRPGPPEEQPACRVARVALLPAPQGMNRGCIHATPPWWQRAVRQLIPQRRSRDCCYYHSTGRHRVSAAAIRIVQQARAEGLAGEAFTDRLAELIGDAKNLLHPEQEALRELPGAETGIQLSRGGRGRRQSYLNGRHKVTAMLEAGVRRTVVIHGEMPQA